MENPVPDPLDYAAQLTIEEARQIYDGVEAAFAEIAAKYGTERVSLIDEADIEAAVKCVGVLLPLGIMDSVQAEIRAGIDLPETLFFKTSNLLNLIMDFAADYDNTGVERFYLPPDAPGLF